MSIFPHAARLAQDAVLSLKRQNPKSEVCQLIHFSTAPTTTILYISFKIYIRIIVIEAVEKWISFPVLYVGWGRRPQPT
jgi:hypothetical protein